MRALIQIVAVCLALSGAALLEAGCGLETKAGYSGPYPSAPAQRALHELTGSTLDAESSGTLTVATPVTELRIESFAVVPNPVTGKGPVVRLRERGRPVTPMNLDAEQGEDGVWYLPVLTDGDAADLVERATGIVPVEFGGETSAAYRDTLGIDED